MGTAALRSTAPASASFRPPARLAAAGRPRRPTARAATASYQPATGPYGPYVAGATATFWTAAERGEATSGTAVERGSFVTT